MSSPRSLTRDDRHAGKAAFRAARRRRAVTLLPGTAIVLWSLADLVAARSARLSIAKAGFLHHIVDHVQPIVWTLAFVLVPLLVSVKPKPKRSGALLALFTGPFLTPLIFGAGGWRLWQIFSLAAIVLFIESGDQARVRRRVIDVREPAEPALVLKPVDEPVADPSFHEMSGASFQRRSSS